MKCAPWDLAADAWGLGREGTGREGGKARGGKVPAAGQRGRQHDRRWGMQRSRLACHVKWRQVILDTTDSSFRPAPDEALFGQLRLGLGERGCVPELGG